MKTPVAQPTALAAALTKAHLVSPGTMESITSGHTYFDPVDVLEDKLGHHPLALYGVLNSMAWMLDSSCISLARQILFDRWAEAESVIDDETGELTKVAFSDFCQNVAENLAHESLYSGEESSEQTLAILMSLRFQWHDATQGSAHACIPPKDYKPKSLRELVENEKPRQANLGTRSNLQRLAAEEANINYDDAKARYIAVNPAKPERAAEFDEMIKQKTERIYQDYLAAAFMSSTQMAESNRKLLNVTLEILRTVGRYAPADARFDELPQDVQARLAKYSLGAINRTRVDLASRLARNPIEFSRMQEATRGAIEALTSIIDKKYEDKGVDEVRYEGNSAEIDAYNRAQRRATLARID